MSHQLRTQGVRGHMPTARGTKNGQKLDHLIIRKLDAHEVCMPQTDASQESPCLCQRREKKNHKSTLRQIFKNVTDATFGRGRGGGEERRKKKKKKKKKLALALIEVLLHITLLDFTYHSF